MTLLIALAVAPLTFLTFCFAVELFAGLRADPAQSTPHRDLSEVVIIIPAHNEEAGLADRLADIIDAVAARARILVVADNCDDSTADVARRFEVEVIERFDAVRRGKGFALDFARQHLRSDPPAYAVVVDADCTVEPATFDRLISACTFSGRPCQAIYLLKPDTTAPPNVQLSNFAFYVKNEVRQRGLQRLAGRAHLVGTGMAFPWPLFDRSALATDNIVEDLGMGLELAEAGYPPKLVDHTVVWSDAATQVNTFHQRRRWEGGYLQSAIKWGPRSLADYIRSRRGRALWAAINLFIPPFALLLLVDVAVLALASLLTLVGITGTLPPTILGSSVIIAGLALVAAWASGGRRFVTARALAQTPFYLAWKIPLYLGLAQRGAPKEWLRTGRG